MNTEINSDTVITNYLNHDFTLGEALQSLYELPGVMMPIIVEQRALVSKEVMTPEQRVASYEKTHREWYERVINEGWTYGEEDDGEKKTSVYLVPWEESNDLYKFNWVALVGAVDSTIQYYSIILNKDEA